MPKISLNMITHNRGKFLSEAIDSILLQTFQDWELIIVDDGSTDDTNEIIKEYQMRDKRIKYIKNEDNLGIVKSRNKALENSTGQYIAVLDSDDVWCDENKLARQVKVLEDDNYVLVGSGVIEIDENGIEKRRYYSPESDEEIRKKILYRNPFAHSSVMFRRDLAVEIGGYRDFLIGEDYDLFLRLGLKGNIKNINKYIVKYRVHKKNISRQKIRQALQNNLQIIKQYKDKYPNFCLAYVRRLVRLGIGWLLFR